MARTPRVAIIGGGIGGLCAALALEQRGIEVVVFEQSPQLGDIGAGLNLSPNALKVFRALGIEDGAVAIGYQGEFQLIRSWHSGRLISRVDRKGFAAKFGAPHLTLHRADLLELLARSLKRTQVRLGARCIAVESDGRAARGAVRRRQYHRGGRGRGIRRPPFRRALLPVRARGAAFHRLHLLSRPRAGR